MVVGPEAYCVTVIRHSDCFGLRTETPFAEGFQPAFDALINLFA